MESAARPAREALWEMEPQSGRPRGTMGDAVLTRPSRGAPWEADSALRAQTEVGGSSDGAPGCGHVQPQTPDVALLPVPLYRWRNLGPGGFAGVARD